MFSVFITAFHLRYVRQFVFDFRILTSVSIYSDDVVYSSAHARVDVESIL